MKFTKEDARRRVLNCAKQYQQKLLNKKLIIIYRLTGLELIDKKGNVLRNQSMNFYRKCIENKLGLEEFRFKQDGTTHLKLAVLPVLMDITKITKITGDYNNVRPYLFVDKVMGGRGECYPPKWDIKFFAKGDGSLFSIRNNFHRIQNVS